MHYNVCISFEFSFIIIIIITSKGWNLILSVTKKYKEPNLIKSYQVSIT